MARKVEPWTGKTDDTPIPPRVKLRVKLRANDCCENCGARVRYGAEIDHVIAVINGGANAEGNLRLLCKTCHAAKTNTDVAEKRVTARKQKSMAGFKNTRKPWYPPKEEPIKAKRVWWIDDRGRECCTWILPREQEE